MSYPVKLCTVGTGGARNAEAEGGNVGVRARAQGAIIFCVFVGQNVDLYIQFGRGSNSPA